MSVYRDGKRGFQTKREALEWERNFVLLKSRCSSKLFRDFWATYTEDIKLKSEEVHGMLRNT